MDSVALAPSLAPALDRARPLGSADAETAPAVVTRIAVVLSAEVARLAATFIAGAARAAALALARPSAVGRKTVWGHGGAHQATSGVVMAGGAQRRGTTLFAPAVLARDPCRGPAHAPALVRVRVRIRRTRGIAGAGAALGRVAGAEEV